MGCQVRNQRVFETFSQIHVDFSVFMGIMKMRRVMDMLIQFRFENSNPSGMIQFWTYRPQKSQSTAITLFHPVMKNFFPLPLSLVPMLVENRM